MFFHVVKVLISAGVIAFAAWLSGKKPELAGFIIALPINTLLVLALSHAEYHDPEASVRLARGIITAVPLSMTFFIPFLLAPKLQLGFWALYGIGVGFIVAAYFVHAYIVRPML